ncbi:SAM pointed domain-containing Ets transcription factor [Astyanax mexicanus]|uniref:SAM pointed domain-containing Ets transcription factor n=1 Tax=Astyanax mexicanus TaxID=7994 RepID=A0A8B9HDM4_ASTMX|nr:SAM pointed domain-containing Ets transcription factor [Astyanax mexicanus]XP_015457069.3 SAM pointed domain-containing Ets transcription factor [Astyanax mexicanus]KAG9276913.1 SAM pointed domain-containing Ets transcription factor [Astyanax mexicanus]
MASPVRVHPDSALLQPTRSGSVFSESSLAHLKREEMDVENLELVDSKPRLDSSERGLTGLYLSCFDMLFTEEAAWLVRVADSSGSVSVGPRLEPCPEPEQCPVIDSPGLGGEPLSPGLEDQVEERSLEQVQSLVVGEVLKDIETACKLLNITPDPVEWSCGNVQKWLLWTEHLYRLPQVGKAFQDLDGKDLCAMTEEDFRQRSPQCGDTLHAHLDIWKSAAWMKERCSVGESRITAGEELWSEADSSCSGQPIHLWQFLRELLLKPHSYGRCIRWLNKEKGIFKIEDSAHVARLWGLRKNRPAMNYDKLSRSIRQYYKKGIIRKPDVSQRLVYQFVHPV